MQCERFEARLQDLLDQRVRPECDAQLLDHAESCENCREILLIQDQLFAGLEMWEPPALSDGFTATVVQRHLAEVTSGSTTQAANRSAASFPMWKLFAGALAASLLIGVVTIANRQRPVTPETPQNNVVPAVVHQKPKPQPASPVETPEPKTEVAITPNNPPATGPNGEPIFGSSNSPDHIAVQWVENVPELLDGRHTGRMIREVTSSLPEVDDSIPGLRPITSSVSYTFGMFRRTLPGGRETAPREDQKAPPPGKPQAEVTRDDGQAQPA